MLSKWGKTWVHVTQLGHLIGGGGGGFQASWNEQCTLTLLPLGPCENELGWLVRDVFGEDSPISHPLDWWLRDSGAMLFCSPVTRGQSVLGLDSCLVTNSGWNQCLLSSYHRVYLFKITCEPSFFIILCSPLNTIVATVMHRSNLKALIKLHTVADCQLRQIRQNQEIWLNPLFVFQ